jgi:2-dehydro-3-deoxyglucarate aldolase
MNRAEAIANVRKRLRAGGTSVGSWLQIPHGAVAEIMGQAGYDWVAIDIEHGSIGVSQLPELCRALELGGTLPLARIARGDPKDCKEALDAGVGGIIVPMIESARQLLAVRDACRWPPAGRRGVGFSRANLYGKHFASYRVEAQEPLLVAMIEHVDAVRELDAIAKVEGLDALLIGPYDLSASMGITGEFDDPRFEAVMEQIRAAARASAVPCGVHVVDPNPELLAERVAQGYRFLAYSIDSVFLRIAAERPAGG